MVLKRVSTLVGFLCQIISSMQRYGQDKVRFTCSVVTSTKYKWQNPRQGAKRTPIPQQRLTLVSLLWPCYHRSLESNQYAFLVTFDSSPRAKKSRRAAVVTTALLPTTKKEKNQKENSLQKWQPSIQLVSLAANNMNSAQGLGNVEQPHFQLIAYFVSCHIKCYLTF